jgi:hypothetical protein|tara:strand:+ start:1002 stop:1625 length:624 start_codon:yes stop_codon:yes gene_type:complete
MYQQPNLINTQQQRNVFLPKLEQFRAAGPIEEYKFDSIKPKKKLKEISKILLPEKKKFIVNYGFKFNYKDRCVVCGSFQTWEPSDYLRPPIPLDRVEKGRPMRGTYCQRHAAIHKQMEMLQQQILAEEHGLDFKAFIPKPKMPQIMRRTPLTNLSPDDVASLTGAGWVIHAPTLTDEESRKQETQRLMLEIENNFKRINFLLGDGEE